MTMRAKIDSNETGLAFAEELSPGVLPATPKWYPLEPNEYDDFGTELTLLARRPINSSRQRKKGAITDLDASGGFNQDLTQTNTQRLLQGFMYADMRQKQNELPDGVVATGYSVADETLYKVGHLVYATDFAAPANNGVKRVIASLNAGEVSVFGAGLTVEASPPEDAHLTVVGYQAAAGTVEIVTGGGFVSLKTSDAGVDFTTFGLVVGEFIFIGGDDVDTSFPSATNNGFKRVHSVTTDTIVFDKSVGPMVAEETTDETVQLYFGKVLKNELGPLIKRRSYQVERQLGAPDTDYPAQVQAEYLIGSFGNELTLNVEQADKINIDFSFVAMDGEQRTAAQGLKGGDRMSLVESDAYNTSTDFNSMRLALFEGTNEAPSPLFAHVLSASLSINNNISVNKAIAVLGGFDVTLGIFEVALELSVYFSTVEAIQAVRRNRDVSFHATIAKNNAGFAVDLPLGALGDARLEIEVDEPVTLPVMMDAATAVKLNPNSDYTLLWCFFDYLPTVAEL